MAESQSVPRPRRGAKATGTTEPTDTSGNRGNGGTDSPPRPRARSDAPKAPTPPKAPTARRPSSRSLEGRLAEFLSTAALPFALQGDDYCAGIIAQRAPDLARSLTALADENPSIKRQLNKIMEGSAWGGVALSVCAIVIPIAQHHDLIPGGDPFVFQYPNSPQRTSRPITGPAAGFGGWSQPAPEDASTMGAPAPADDNPDGTDEGWTRVPGAPPGVVTVAATTAGHNGAR